jgi:hypothetical protein
MPTVTVGADHSGKPVVNLYVGVGLPKSEILRERGMPIPVARRLRALVDTGASRTVVEEEHLRSLGLLPLGEAYVHTASTERDAVPRNIYAVALSLAEEVTGTLARNLLILSAGDLSGLGVQILLGRDVLSRGILTYDGPGREFSLEFVDEDDGP